MLSFSTISLHLSTLSLFSLFSISKFSRVGFLTLSAKTELRKSRILFSKLPLRLLYSSLLTKWTWGISSPSFGGCEKTRFSLFTRPIRFVRSFPYKLVPLRTNSELMGKLMPSRITLFAIINWSSGIWEYLYSKYSFTLSGILPCK